MGTDSTACPGADSPRGPSPEDPGRHAARLWRAAAVAILILAAFLRLYALELRPFHHDEGVNGLFLSHLYRTGQYHYDPTNYHGPTLYYTAVVAVYLFGLSSLAVRLVAAFFGLLTVWLALRSRRLIGAPGALAAGILLAVSPGAVFFSRYFIHEILLVAGTLGLVVAAREFAESRRLAPLLVASACAAWMFATKETATPTLVVLLLALLCAQGYDALRHRRWPSLARLRASLPPRRELVLLGACALLLFLVINLLLYSSFFTNPKGVVDALRALRFWAATGTHAHIKAWWTHAYWLWRAEAPLVVLGLVGLVTALVLAERRATTFLAFWAVGITCAYSLVPYKTPWLTLNIVLPLALLAGYAVDVAARLSRIVAMLLLLSAATLALRQTIDLNFERYDDETSQVYVYAHTRRGFLDLITAVERVALESGQSTSAKITVTAREHWPLPWYLRNFRATAYLDRIEIAREGLMVIGQSDQETQLARALGPAFHRLGGHLESALQIHEVQRYLQDRPFEFHAKIITEGANLTAELFTRLKRLGHQGDSVDCNDIITAEYKACVGERKGHE